VAFELVESIYLDESDDEIVAWNIDRIKELGIEIEIDDFGTGYASIVSLMRLRPARLKIDRQLVIPILQSAAQQQLLASIIDIGRSLGIEIDDFGTGYASVVSLMRLRPARLKIDRQLVIPILQSAAQQQLLASIIDIGRSLGIETVAEGVETAQHAELLAQLGVDALQGFAFARPMSAEALEDFVVAEPWRARPKTLPAGQRHY
jgi:EAL domain-containing protein (putative c-di-GMP-specific phosphodiesterase class I)